jgi:hypothetical protein
MSIYFIEDPNGIIYELDATADITYRLSGKVTSNPVESGESVADNYVNNPDVITLKGSISDVKSISSGGVPSKQTLDFITGLKALKVNRALLSLHFGSKVGVITDCVIESLDIIQNAQRGSLGAGRAGRIDSFRVSITLKQIRLATRARLTAVRSEVIANDAKRETEGGGSTATITEDKKRILEISAELWGLRQ